MPNPSPSNAITSGGPRRRARHDTQRERKRDERDDRRGPRARAGSSCARRRRAAAPARARRAPRLRLPRRRAVAARARRARPAAAGRATPATRRSQSPTPWRREQARDAQQRQREQQDRRAASAAAQLPTRPFHSSASSRRPGPVTRQASRAWRRMRAPAAGSRRDDRRQCSPRGVLRAGREGGDARHRRRCDASASSGAGCATSR